MKKSTRSGARPGAGAVTPSGAGAADIPGRVLLLALKLFVGDLEHDEPLGDVAQLTLLLGAERARRDVDVERGQRARGRGLVAGDGDLRHEPHLVRRRVEQPGR